MPRLQQRVSTGFTHRTPTMKDFELRVKQCDYGWEGSIQVQETIISTLCCKRPEDIGIMIDELMKSIESDHD